ncbi:MAG TPA: hypothetical protein VKY22_17830 [Bradyrhizobium sp.]|nr:hypothetical protein [Bradyrhizobium sp.]
MPAIHGDVQQLDGTAQPALDGLASEPSVLGDDCVGMRSHIPQMVLVHAGLTGLSALLLTTLGSEAVNDSLTRLILIAVFSSWAAVGSGITAFLMLSVEQDSARNASRRDPRRALPR